MDSATSALLGMGLAAAGVAGAGVGIGYIFGKMIGGGARQPEAEGRVGKYNSTVTKIAPAPSTEAEAHFSKRLTFETDCWDVHHALTNGAADFVVLDVRWRNAYTAGHVPGAVSMPHAEIDAERMSAWPAGTVFVVYCAGPHCNGANKAALRLARLGRPVKEMIGGVTGWTEEGFPFATGPEPGSLGTGR